MATRTLTRAELEAAIAGKRRFQVECELARDHYLAEKTRLEIDALLDSLTRQQNGV
jgi:hypothetical protein